MLAILTTYMETRLNMTDLTDLTLLCRAATCNGLKKHVAISGCNLQWCQKISSIVVKVEPNSTTTCVAMVLRDKFHVNCSMSKHARFSNLSRNFFDL